jgi:hypothetical protein
LLQYNGKRVYETLQTTTNEIGQICVQALTGSDSHKQLDPALTAMTRTMNERGQRGPEYSFTDNPSHDKQFLLSKFESLRKTQAKLDQFAAKLNNPEVDANVGETANAQLPAASAGKEDKEGGAAPRNIDSSLPSGISFQVVEP